VKSELGEYFESHGVTKMELFYNQRRRHSALGQMSPAAFERGASKREWTPWKPAFPTALTPLHVLRDRRTTAFPRMSRALEWTAAVGEA